MKIEDNFLDQEEFIKLQTFMMDGGFAWHYNDGIDDGEQMLDLDESFPRPKAGFSVGPMKITLIPDSLSRLDSRSRKSHQKINFRS